MNPDANRAERYGPYEPVSVLAQGGMSVIYLARHVGNQTTVALKTLGATRPFDLQSIRREIEALRRIEHPHIIGIIDSGEEDGIPWYAMEQIEGVTLATELKKRRLMQAADRLEEDSESRTLIIDGLSDALADEDGETTEWVAGSQRTPSALYGAVRNENKDLLSQLAQICHALSYLHSEGIVHGDLKPENILLTTDKKALLVDFGIMAWDSGRVHQSSLNNVGVLMGTLSYASPERLRGNLPDARSDLYSLGCILFEVLTGSPPFEGERPALILGHCGPDIPALPPRAASAALRQMVRTLLAKRPIERPGHVEAVLYVLERVGIEMPDSSVLPAVVPHLHNAQMVGRAPIIEKLDKSIQEVRNQRGDVIFLEGPAGIGKTRLVAEFVHTARAQGVHVLVGSCSANRSVHASQQPLNGFLPILQSIADLASQSETETKALFGSRIGILRTYAPYLDQLPGATERTRPSDLPVAMASRRLVGAIDDTLLAFFGDDPTVLIIDDLQWADKLTLEVLTALLPQFRRRGWLFVGLMRSANLRDDLDRLTSRYGESLRVDALQKSEVDQAIGQMLGMTSPPESLRAHVFEESQGNPFLVGESIRSAVERGVLHLDKTGQWTWIEGATEQLDSLPIPDSLRALVSMRLQQLGPRSRYIFEAACVLGNPIEESVLSKVIELETKALRAGLADLQRREILRPIDSGRLRFQAHGGRWQFCHSKVLELGYARLNRDLRRRLHARAADTLSNADFPTDSTLLGYHFEKCGAHHQALNAYTTAARQAVSEERLVAARHLYGQAIALPTENPEGRARLRVEMFEELVRLPERAELEKPLFELIDILDPKEDPALRMRALQVLFILLISRGAEQEAEEALNESIVLAEKTAHKKGIAQGMQGRGDLLRRRGHFAAAIEAYDRTIELTRQLKERQLEGMALGSKALALIVQGDYHTSMTLYETQLEITRELADLRAESLVYQNMAHIFTQTGRPKEAIHCHDRALAIHQEIGSRDLEAMTLGNLGRLYQDMGRFEEAIETGEKAIEIAIEIDDHRGLSCRYVMLSRAFRLQGQYERAEEFLERGSTGLKSVGTPVDRVMANLEKAHLLLATERHEAAKALSIEIGQAIEGMALGKDSLLSRRKNALIAALKRYDKAQPLIAGEHPDELSLACRRRLEVAGR